MQGQIVGSVERYSAYATPRVDVDGDGYVDAINSALNGSVTYLNLAGARP